MRRLAVGAAVILGAVIVVVVVVTNSFDLPYAHHPNLRRQVRERALPPAIGSNVYGRFDMPDGGVIALRDERCVVPSGVMVVDACGDLLHRIHEVTDWDVPIEVKGLHFDMAPFHANTIWEKH